MGVCALIGEKFEIIPRPRFRPHLEKTFSSTVVKEHVKFMDLSVKIKLRICQQVTILFPLLLFFSSSSHDNDLVAVVIYSFFYIIRTELLCRNLSPLRNTFF